MGLSRGITADLTSLGKVTVMGPMCIGRVGVVSLALAALARPDGEATAPRRESDLVV